MGLKRQLKMFAPSQQTCVCCAAPFVPWSRDLVRLWDSELDLEPDWLTSRKWAIDRIYQEVQKNCSAKCAELTAQADRARESQDAWERLNRKYR